jgi:adenosylhomocysteine nucleosidase
MVIVVVGLEFESRIAARIGTCIVCNNDFRNLASDLACAIPMNCDGLISFGLAGGLSPYVQPGTCVVGSAILSEGFRYVTDESWARDITRSIPSAIRGTILGVYAPVTDPIERHNLFCRTGAVAEDMESHIVASVAKARGLAVGAIRVIANPAARILPTAALKAMRPNGTISVASVIGSVIKRPTELLQLLRLVRDAQAGRATLLAISGALGQGRLPDPKRTEIDLGLARSGCTKRDRELSSYL